MGPFRVFFDPLSTQETAGRKALPDVADALGLYVEAVDRWNDETCTPLPGCDEEAASVCSVEDLLHEFALDRCVKTDLGWQPIGHGERPVDVEAIDRTVQQEAAHLGASARPPDKALGDWLMAGVPNRRTPGHRPFFDKSFKSQIVHGAQDLNVAKLLVHEAVSKIVRLILADTHVGRPQAFDNARRRAARLRACLVEELRAHYLERGMPANRAAVPEVLRAAWAEASSRRSTSDVRRTGGKVVIQVSIRRQGSSMRFDVVDVDEYVDSIRDRGQPVPETWRAGFMVHFDRKHDSVREAKDRQAALQFFLLHDEDVKFIEMAG
jgi:hypothetical protein